MRTLYLLVLTGCVSASATTTPTGDWVAYGHDALGSRYSPLSSVNRKNVGQLTVAWTYHTGETAPAFATKREKKFEATPLVVDGSMYLSTPLGRVMALDPTTGAERWTFDPHMDKGADYGDFANRGVSTWVDPAAAPGAACRRRIFVGVVDARLIALDAATGKPCDGFADHGTLDLKHGLRTGADWVEEYEETSPPAIIHGLVVVGSAVADNTRINAASGEVRAFDARTGALRWTWDPVPQDSTDPAWHSWVGPHAHQTGAANAWSVIAADAARDMVFVPTGSASVDYWGGERLGDNRYANSITALNASTGKVVWSFQTVHHDLWDYDNAAPPALVTIGGVDAVLQATKTGMLFVLDRGTGKPLFPVEERPVPKSTIPGEQASPTQPFSIVLSPHRLNIDSVPADCRSMYAGLRNEGIFTPPSLEGTVVLPSNIGGVSWGGVSYDPTRTRAVVAVNTVVAEVQLIPVDKVDPAAKDSMQSRYGYQYTRMHGTPWVMRRRILITPQQVPCSPPPFGRLVAIDLKTGQRAWDVPLGGPAGTPTLGGPIITAGGLVFMAGTIDRKIRAFDIETGHELWSGDLPAGARATPMTYTGSDGRQYIAVSAGGGDFWGPGDAVVAFAIPR